MTERELRNLIESVRKGAVSRREFVATLLGLGIAAPIAGQLLLHSGIAQAQPARGHRGHLDPGWRGARDDARVLAGPPVSHLCSTAPKHTLFSQIFSITLIGTQ